MKDAKIKNTDKNEIRPYNSSTKKIKLPFGLLNYCETKATLQICEEKAYGVNNIVRLQPSCQSTKLTENLSKNKINNELERIFD